MTACEDGVTGGNAPLQNTKYFLMPLSALKSNPAFERPRPNPFTSPSAPTGNILSIKVSSTGDAPAERYYSSIEGLERTSRKVTAVGLKDAVSDGLDKLFEGLLMRVKNGRKYRSSCTLARFNEWRV